MKTYNFIISVIKYVKIAETELEMSSFKKFLLLGTLPLDPIGGNPQNFQIFFTLVSLMPDV